MTEEKDDRKTQRVKIRDQAKEQGQAALEGMYGRGPADEEGDGAVEAEANEPSEPDDPNQPAPGPAAPAPAPVAPKIRLKEKDKPVLAKRVAPVLAPAIENMAKQIVDAKGNKGGYFIKTVAPDDQASAEPMCQAMAFCIPQVEHLSQVIKDEREAIVDEREQEKAQQIASDAAKARKEEKKKANAAQQSIISQLKATFHRKACTHLIASQYYDFQHKWAIFIPIQIIVAIIAITAFLATYWEGSNDHGSKETARALTVIAGVLGIVAGFVNAIDRYLDWRTKAQMHNKAAALYSKLKWKIRIDDMEAMASGGGTTGQNRLQITKIKEKLSELEEHNGDLLVPLQIINVFDEIESEVRKQVSIHNDEIDKGTRPSDEIIPSKTSVRGELLGLHNPKISPHDQADLQIQAYNILTGKIIHRGCCSGFPFALPLPLTILRKAKKMTKNEIFMIIQAKCDDKQLGRSSLNKDTDIHGKNKVFADEPAPPPQEGCCYPRKSTGAPPSADNNV